MCASSIDKGPRRWDRFHLTPPVESGVTYPTLVLVETVVRSLQDRPAIHLCTVARESGVSCRTVRRALRICRGISFRELQTQALRARIEELHGAAGVHSIKEIAHVLGFTSPASFSRRMKSVMRIEPRGRIPKE